MTTTEIALETLKATPLPLHDGAVDKDDRGRALVVAGSLSVPGGALLAGQAALRAGAGKLRIATCKSIATQLGLAFPEARVIGLPETPEGDIDVRSGDRLLHWAQQSDAVLMGPGMIEKVSAPRIAADMLRCSPGPGFVLDAAAMDCLRSGKEHLVQHADRMVITPHAGEMAGLLDVPRERILADPLSYAKQAVRSLHCIVVLKGPQTIVADASDEAWIYKGGSIGLATSGSGDTLAGVIVGLLARGARAPEAARWGVYLHGEAGRRLARSCGPVGYLARDLLTEIPAIMAEAI